MCENNSEFLYQMTLYDITFFVPPCTNKHFKCKKVSGCLQVIQKAMIEVDEEGTEAAAATAIVSNDYEMSEKIEFIADHPFLFFLRDLKTGLLLFQGRVVDPRP